MDVSRFLALLAVACIAAGCASRPIENPIAELGDPQNRAQRHLAAMAMLDESPASAEYIETLHGLVWRPGYFSLDVREQAVDRLERLDPEGLMRTIRQRLPNMTMWPWLTRLSAIIAERGWSELSPALVSSWSRPTVFVREEAERPEYKALAALHGEDRILDVIFELFLDARSVAQQGYRTRSWDLMMRLGQRDRLAALLRSSEIPEDDAMLLDLKAGAAELGIIPANREEILWLRSLRKPEHAEFWSQAAQALRTLSDERKAALELRDLAIIVAAHRHEPELLTRSRSELYEKVDAYLRTQRHHTPRSNYDNVRGSGRERLYEYRDSLTWGDLAAMQMAVRAVRSPGMAAHLFDYAERDREDKSTEYGGIIRLDERGEFELVEFPPRIRHHDHKFIASQEMFDAAYTAVFHFHYHAQQYHNVSHTGPGLGDLNYADNTRANCLVLTFVNRDTLNMDYYRHGRVIVDLGEVKR